jgi:hypothetical protein
MRVLGHLLQNRGTQSRPDALAFLLARSANVRFLCRVGFRRSFRASVYVGDGMPTKVGGIQEKQFTPHCAEHGCPGRLAEALLCCSARSTRAGSSWRDRSKRDFIAGTLMCSREDLSAMEVRRRSGDITSPFAYQKFTPDVAGLPANFAALASSCWSAGWPQSVRSVEKAQNRR